MMKPMESDQPFWRSPPSKLQPARRLDHLINYANSHSTMHNVFRGWRRKTGVVTLVMALAFVGGWIRSLSVTDSCQFPVRNRWHVGFVSHGGRFSCGWADLKGAMRNDWRSVDTHGPIAIRVRSLYFDFTEGKAPYSGGTAAQLMISYWSMTLPLTLFSAFLLLVPSRTRPKMGSRSHA